MEILSVQHSTLKFLSLNFISCCRSLKSSTGYVVIATIDINCEARGVLHNLE